MVARVFLWRAVYTLTVHDVPELKQTLIDTANRTAIKLSVTPNPNQHKHPILPPNSQGYSCCSVPNRCE